MPISVSEEGNHSLGQSPISNDWAKSLVEENGSVLSSASNFISALSKRLAARSSKHKFLVQLTTIDADDSEATIKAAIGGVWDLERDGYLSYRVTGDLIYLVTIVWIALD